MSSAAQSPRGNTEEPTQSATPGRDDDAEGLGADNNAPPDDEEPMNAPDHFPDFEVKEQDRWLPIANVARIMKTALPENAKIAKEAKECMQECVSEFISFITSEASEKCQQEKRKTVNGEDILFAMTSLGFENYGEALKIYLARYRENLVARGDHQKPAGAPGMPQPGEGAYDPSAQHVLANPMDPSVDTNDFYGAHPTAQYD